MWLISLNLLQKLDRQEMASGAFGSSSDMVVICGGRDKSDQSLAAACRYLDLEAPDNVFSTVDAFGIEATDASMLYWNGDDESSSSVIVIGGKNDDEHITTWTEFDMVNKIQRDQRTFASEFDETGLPGATHGCVVVLDESRFFYTS